MDNMIAINNLSKTYYSPQSNIKALDDVSLTIEKGDIFGIIGFSGAGKSTLIRCLNRLEEPDSGSVFIEDREITAMNKKQLREARKKIGMIFFLQFNIFFLQIFLINLQTYRHFK